MAGAGLGSMAWFFTMASSLFSGYSVSGMFLFSLQYQDTIKAVVDELNNCKSLHTTSCPIPLSKADALQSESMVLWRRSATFFLMGHDTWLMGLIFRTHQMGLSGM